MHPAWTKKDKLSRYKEEFYLPDHLYYEANGLGPMSRRSEKTLKRVADEWKNQLVAGWFCGEIPWFYYPERIAAMEEGIVGAQERELIINGTTTTNIHSVLAAFYRPEGKRTKLLCDSQIFSSDRYAVEAQIRLKGLDPEEVLVLAGGDSPILDEEDLITHMTRWPCPDGTAMLPIPPASFSIWSVWPGRPSEEGSRWDLT